MSKRVKITLLLSAVCLLMGIRKNWREYTYRKATVFAEATILSVDTELMSGKAIASLDYLLEYKKDNVKDTISFSTTEAYSIKDPLPSIEELKKNKFYIHYVPKSKRSVTPYNHRIYIINSKIIDGDFYSGWFNLMFFIILSRYLLQGRSDKIR